MINLPFADSFKINFCLSSFDNEPGVIAFAIAGISTPASQTANGVMVTIKDAANNNDSPVGHQQFHLKDISWHGSHI
jgi:hypothetical protein